MKIYETNENPQSAMLTSYSDFETWEYELQNKIANHKPIINDWTFLKVMAWQLNVIANIRKIKFCVIWNKYTVI